MSSAITEFLQEFNQKFGASIVLQAFVVVLLTYCIFWLWSRKKFYALSAHLPGPTWIPFLSNGYQLKFHRPGTEFIDALLNLCKKYPSPFRLWTGFEFNVVIHEPEDYEEIFTSKTFIYKDNNYDNMTKYIGLGLITSSGSLWKKQRKILNPAFCTSTLRSYFPIINRHSRYLVENLMENCDKGFVETKTYSQRFVTGAILESMFDMKENFYKGEFDDVIESSLLFTELMIDRSIKFWQKWDLIYALCPNSKELDKYLTQYRQYFHPLLKEKLRNYVNNKKINGGTNTETVKTPLTVLMNAFYDGHLTEQEVIIEFDHIFNAGVTTSYSQVSFFMLMMGMHKDIQNKLHQEVQEVLGNEADDQLEITPDHLKQMPYLNMCTKELFRLFSTGPITSRIVQEDFELKTRGIVIPAGTHIIVPMYATHRNPKYWDKPYYYIPERFSPEECKKRPQYSYIPFHGGKRDCLGKNYVSDMLRIVGAHLIKNYKFHSDFKMETLELASESSTRSVKGYKVVITIRSK